MNTMKQGRKRFYRFVGFLGFLFLLAGCQTDPLAKETETVEGLGVTYQFQLPANWQSIDDYADRYGRAVVYGAEDTRSKSGMSVLIFSKESVKEEGFGERTRKELAQQNGYKKPEDIYMKESTINGAKTYKFTLQTQYGNKKTWAHYYCLFTEHGVIQLLYYSADDSTYEKRVKLIDASIETVKETGYDEAAAKQANEPAEDQIAFQTAEYGVNMNGLATVAGEKDQTLLVLRYQLKNTSDQALAADQWRAAIQLKQGDATLEEGTLPADSISYELRELIDSGKQTVDPGDTKEGVLLYVLQGKEPVTMRFVQEVTSEKTEYSLVLPEKEK